MTRLLLSTVAAAVLLAAPIAGFAQTTPATPAPAKPMTPPPAAPMTPAKPAATPMPAKPMPAKPMAAKPMARKPMAKRMLPRDNQSAAVDALNAQALTRAKGGQ